MADGMFGGGVSGRRVFCWVGVQRAHSTIVVPMTPAEQSPRSSRLVSAATLGRARAIGGAAVREGAPFRRTEVTQYVQTPGRHVDWWWMNYVMGRLVPTSRRQHMPGPLACRGRSALPERRADSQPRHPWTSHRSGSPFWRRWGCPLSGQCNDRRAGASQYASGL